MPSWVSALAIAILVVVIPFTLILKIMLQLLVNRRIAFPVCV